VIPALDGLQRTSRTISSGFVHGFITLELAEHLMEFDDPVAKVLVPMGECRSRAGRQAGTCRGLTPGGDAPDDSVTRRSMAPSNKEPRPTK
jgi:hypothetical protein